MSERIGVMGAGVMGSGIAQVMAISGHEVICRDLSEDVLDAAREGVDTGRFGVRGAVERGKLTAEEADAALARLSFTTDLEPAVDVDLIIEAVPENLALKIKFWRDLDSMAPDDTIFASNSSGFPIAAMAAGTNRPDRFIGWHWASPAPVMKLAEIVRCPETSETTVDTVVRLAAAAGKNPVVVQDTDQSWGYVANRVYFAMVREANRVVSEGIADREQVDQLMTDCFRWPSGPYGMAAGAGSGWS
ncbi:MAG: 3-hydroxyacyl-CoA dehydrogenase family protein [Acidimicrobiales bacterium]|jgi:3-hydroxyacyl-CoA dehydrogenase|nr:3-hydroxyacyl-CoA dehydrogenase family protein [Acidimicrobiales bacterium]